VAPASGGSSSRSSRWMARTVAPEYPSPTSRTPSGVSTNTNGHEVFVASATSPTISPTPAAAPATAPATIPMRDHTRPSSKYTWSSVIVRESTVTSRAAGADGPPVVSRPKRNGASMRSTSMWRHPSAPSTRYRIRGGRSPAWGTTSRGISNRVRGIARYGVQPPTDDRSASQASPAAGGRRRANGRGRGAMAVVQSKRRAAKCPSPPRCEPPPRAGGCRRGVCRMPHRPVASPRRLSPRGPSAPSARQCRRRILCSL
jgi:hypothetical protein